MIYKNLRELKKENNNIYGTKASNLGEMINRGISVPEGFALSSEFYDRYNRDLQNPEALKILKEIFQSLKSPELAVRSSALCEDSSKHSMAGIYSSFTGITTFKEMIEAVKKCYASLHTDKALSFYLTHRISPQNIKMPIIIQSFKKGEPSGVVFTADPVKNDLTQITLSGTMSICEDFVQGRGETFHLSFSKDGDEMQNHEYHEILNTALEIEKIFMTPQDIEWTLSDKCLWILQARPVTNLKRKKLPLKWKKEEDSHYTWNCMLKDVKPLNQEIALLSKEAYNRGCEISGLSFFYEEFLPMGNALYIRQKELKDSKTLSESYQNYLTELRNQGKNVFTDVALPHIESMAEEIHPFLNRELIPQEIIQFMDLALKYRLETESYHWRVIHGALNEWHLNDLKQKYDLTTMEALELISSETLLGCQRREFQEAIMALQSDREIRELFENCPYNNLLAEKLWNNEKGHKILSSYMDKYGLHALAWNSFEVLEERPDKLIEQLRPRVLQPKQNHVSEPSKFRKEETEARIISKLPVEDQQDFQKELSFLRKSYLVRDNHAFYIDTGAQGYLRKAIINAGEYLVQEGKLDFYDDIEYFTLDEIKKILTDPSFPLNIQERKKEWENSCFIPQTIGKKQPEREPSPSVATETTGSPEELKGIAGFIGTVSGAVIHPREIDKAEGDNYILVLKDVRQMDPAPHRHKLAGLIFENGSPLDHVGIWARETGLPALFGIKNCSALLQGGETLTLNGDDERVILHR